MANYVEYINSKGQQVTPSWKTFEKDFLKPKKLVEHHTSYARGYQTVRYDSVVPYKGKFGEGVAVYSNSPKSTRYKLVTYYIKQG